MAPEGSGFGYVVAVTVDDGERFIHASDLQGPASPVATAYLVRERPDLVYVSGPPTYLQGQIGREVVQRGVDNLVRLVGETGCRVIVDHHAVREPRFRDRLAQAFGTGRVMTAAEYLGRGDECLEARRAALWARRRRGRPDGREAAAGTVSAARARVTEEDGSCRRCRRWASRRRTSSSRASAAGRGALPHSGDAHVVLLFYVLDWTPG